MNHLSKLICYSAMHILMLTSCTTYKDNLGISKDHYPSFQHVSIESSANASLSLEDSSSDSVSYDSLSVDLLSMNNSSVDSQSSLDSEPLGELSLDIEPLACSDYPSHTEECSANASQSSLPISLLCADGCEEYFNLPSPVVNTEDYKTVCEGDNEVILPPSPREELNVTDEEEEMMEYIIQQEAGNGSYRHKCIIAEVILNRVRDSRFPNTVEGVLFQKNQFSSTWNYYQREKEPDEETERAVEDVLEGNVEDESSGSLYFHSMKNDGWFSSLTFVMEVEGHRFFK